MLQPVGFIECAYSLLEAALGASASRMPLLPEELGMLRKKLLPHSIKDQQVDQFVSSVLQKADRHERSGQITVGIAGVTHSDLSGPSGERAPVIHARGAFHSMAGEQEGSTF